jgi:hypothetical protein
MKFAHVSINYFYVSSQNQYIWQIKLANMKNIDITKAGLMIFISPLDELNLYLMVHSIVLQFEKIWLIL